MPMCYSQYDCSPGQYCDVNYACYDCSYVTPGSCDSIDNDCCGAAFLGQCPSDPFKCGGSGDSGGASPVQAKKKCKGDACGDFDVELILMIVCACAAAYVALGTLYGVQAQGKRGLSALPHYFFWSELAGLVKDGTSFVTGNGGRGRPYAPVPDVEAPVEKAAAGAPLSPEKKRTTFAADTSLADGKKKKKKKRVPVAAPNSADPPSSME